jgi:hypothetical protein
MWSNDELNAFQKHCFKEELGDSEIEALKKVISKESEALQNNKVLRSILLHSISFSNYSLLTLLYFSIYVRSIVI